MKTLEKIKAVFKKTFKKKSPCHCGNPESCSGKYGGLVLYNIIGNGVAVADRKRFYRCEKIRSQMRDPRLRNLVKRKEDQNG